MATVTMALYAHIEKLVDVGSYSRHEGNSESILWKP